MTFFSSVEQDYIYLHLYLHYKNVPKHTLYSSFKLFLVGNVYM